MQSDTWAGKSLDTETRQNTFRNEHYHIVYQKALEMSRSNAYAALLCDYVFEVMDQRFASRALPKECDIYLTAQVCLAYARYGNDIDRLRVSLQNIVAQRDLERGERKAQAHGEEETSWNGVSPECPQQGENACQEKTSGGEEESQAERKEEPQVENRYAQTCETEKKEPEKRMNGSGTAQKERPEACAAGQGASASGVNGAQGMPSYAQQVPYGQPVYYGYPYGMPVMPAPGVAPVFPYGQQMISGVAPGLGMPYGQEGMQPYMPYVQPVMYFTAPAYCGFPPAGMMQPGVAMPQQAGQPAPGQMPAPFIRTQMMPEDERTAAPASPARGRARAVPAEELPRRKARLRDAQRRENLSARSKRKTQPLEHSNSAHGVRKPDAVRSGVAQARPAPEKAGQMAGGREKIQPVRQMQPIRTPAEAGGISSHSVAEPELPKIVKISASATPVQTDDMTRSHAAVQSTQAQQVSPEQASVALQGEAAQQVPAARTPVTAQSEAAQQAPAAQTPVAEQGGAVQQTTAPASTAAASPNASATVSQSETEMATIVKNTVYNRTATKLWMPGDAMGMPEDGENNGNDEDDEEEEEERSVRLSVLNTGLVLLTIPAVVFLLMEMGIISILF